MFKNEEYSSFLNIFICLVLKCDKFTSFISLFGLLGYPIRPRPFVGEKCVVRSVGVCVTGKTHVQHFRVKVTFLTFINFLDCAS